MSSLKQATSIIFVWFPVFLLPIFLTRVFVDGWQPTILALSGGAEVVPAAVSSDEVTLVVPSVAPEDERALQLKALLTSCDDACGNLEETLRRARRELDLVRARLNEAVAVSHRTAVALDR